MASEPKDAHEAFQMLTPRLMEVAKAIEALPASERLRCAHMLVGYFVAVANAQGQVSPEHDQLDLAG